MEQFWILILVSFFALSLDKAESIQLEELEELPLQSFDELFVDEWLDKDEAAEDLKRPTTNFGQNVHHQIDRQNAQLGQIEPNSTDQNPSLTQSDHSGQIEHNSTDQLGQIEPNSTYQNPSLTQSDHSGQIEHSSTDQLGQTEPNSTDQNASLTESDHSDNAKNGEEQSHIMKVNEKLAEDERKCTIIDKFIAIKEEFKQKGQYSKKEWVQIDNKIAKDLKVNRSKIYKWKKEFGLTHKFYEKEQRKHLIKKFDQMKAELKRDGFKNSQNELDKTVAEELGLCFKTLYNWKQKLGQTTPKHKHSDNEQKELMKLYYEIKDKNPKNSDEDIAKMLKIGRATLYRWKKQFKQQQLHPNSVNGHSVEENAAANVREIENSNSEYLNE